MRLELGKSGGKFHLKKNHPIFKNKLYFRLKSPVFSIFILPPLLPSSNLTRSCDVVVVVDVEH